MRTFIPFAALAFALMTACASTQAPEPKASTAASAASIAKPDASKTRAHLVQHVSYPATRAQILAACADTPEFSASEKQWLSDNLPDGKYANSDDVVRALKL